MTPFTYLEPGSVAEALELLAKYGDEAKLLAGGTGLVNLMKLNLVQPVVLIGLKSLTGLIGVRVLDEGLHVGALTTLRTLQDSGRLKNHANLLSDACSHVATVRVRDMATLGGAMAHADPHMDTPPALIALGARIVVESTRGRRAIPVEEFFIGYFETVLASDELVTGIEIPAQPSGNGTAFLKFLPGSQDDYATISVAARITLDAGGMIAEARIALGAAGLTPVRATKVEAALFGARPDEKVFAETARLVRDAIEPISDFRGSAEYKRNMAIVHVRRALILAASRARMPA
jgi:carbon-monoxide dehydrogenase medium subunit